MSDKNATSTGTTFSPGSEHISSTKPISESSAIQDDVDDAVAKILASSSHDPITFEIKEKFIRMDAGDSYLRIERSKWNRIMALLPLIGDVLDASS
jgi:hypothetical protein